MIEHVDPWAITIIVVCAPLATVAVSGMLDVFGRKPYGALRPDVRRGVTRGLQNQDTISQSELSASPPLASDNQS